MRCNLNCERAVSMADYSWFKTGILHPDRVMDEHDLVYLLQGSWEIWEDEIPYLLVPGDVILLEAGRHHYGRAACADNTRTMYFHMSLPYRGVSPEAGEAVLRTLIHCRQSPQVRTLFEEIIQVHWSASSLKAEKLSSLCRLLLCELAECSDSDRTGGEHLMQQVLRLVQTSPDRFLTSAEFAQKLFLSERTLRNRFRSLYGKTPCQYQMEIKLQAACGYLRNNPNMTIREIAANLGFYDEFHFSRRFKEFYAVSPFQFRSLRTGPEPAAGRVIPIPAAEGSAVCDTTKG